MDSETRQPIGEQPEAGPREPLIWNEALEQTEQESGLKRIFLGSTGLRTGWSILIWIVLSFLLLAAFSFVFAQIGLLQSKAGFTPSNMFFNELASVLGVLTSSTVMAFIERRRILDYNLAGPNRPRYFFSGLAVGFAALSALIGLLAGGGWLHFGGMALSGFAVIRYGIIWGGVFLLVACFEEGSFRCYLQSTLTRSINFWWALGTIALICGVLAIRAKGNGVWGDYALALLGLIPCLVLHQRRSASSGFWQAAWVTSTFFGFVHTSNGGENWIGIFAAGAIGFVFCVSIWLTGSAWWALGAHAGWDWGETFFYGTPDSGLVARGHYLTTSLTGNPLWSGGTDGPEGSLLVLAVILLMLVWLLVIYRTRKANRPATADPAEVDSSTSTFSA